MILFLDFDGVLHPDAVFRPANKPLELRAPGELFMHAGILEDLLEQHPDVRIVLSTSWVRMLGYERTLKKMPEGLRGRVAGATWSKHMRHGGNDPFNDWTRFEQIWSHTQRHCILEWIAIDDLHSGEEDWPEEHRDRLVLTNPDLGLSCPTAQEELRRKLKP